MEHIKAVFNSSGTLAPTIFFLWNFRSISNISRSHAPIVVKLNSMMWPLWLFAH